MKKPASKPSTQHNTKAVTLIDLEPNWNSHSNEWEVCESDERGNALEVYNFNTEDEGISFINDWIEKKITPKTTHNMKTRIVISLTGGVVQGVLCDSPVEILLLDYDVEGADPSTVVSVPQCTKPTEESDHELAFLARVNPEANPDRVQQLFNLKSHE